MTERAKWGLLALLAMVWVGLLAMRVVTQEEPVRVPLKYQSGQALSKAAGTQASSVPTVARLAKSREGGITFQLPKNIFAPLERPEDIAEQQAKARMRVAGSGKAKARSVFPKGPPPSPAELAAQQAQQQRQAAALWAHQAMAQYRFIGYLMQNGEPRAFLGKGRELYIVRAGETLEGQIHVASIETSSLKLRDEASDVESALPLVKEEGRSDGF